MLAPQDPHPSSLSLERAAAGTRTAEQAAGDKNSPRVVLIIDLILSPGLLQASRLRARETHKLCSSATYHEPHVRRETYNPTWRDRPSLPPPSGTSRLHLLHSARVIAWCNPRRYVQGRSVILGPPLGCTIARPKFLRAHFGFKFQKVCIYKYFLVVSINSDFSEF